MVFTFKIQTCKEFCLSKHKKNNNSFPNVDEDNECSYNEFDKWRTMNLSSASSLT